MKRLTLALGALVLVLSASSPASAHYTVIRWSTGWCSVWSDDNTHVWPTWEKYTRVSRHHSTWNGAWTVMERRWGQKVCN